MLKVKDIERIPVDCTMTEFVGTTVLDTIGLVIPGVTPALLEQMNLSKAYPSLGLISSRTGAAGQINAVDEAVKSTNTEVVSIELPRDTKGWGGHGNFIIIGGENVSDVRRAVEIALEYTGKYAGELYISEAGHLEFTFSANAGQALNMAFNAPIGKAFGFFCGSPAAIGLVMADLAVKSSPVEIIKYMTPDKGTSHSNEVIVAVTGDASAVKNAVLTARETGLKLLISLGSYPETPSVPYLR
ncbi:microcompartment protein PduB [Faecalicatena orotica]|uniref:microcompartment protein PduB n=1 Tax=Faecalicatena orotica TaxID=1544 RepID=UPI003216411D